MSHLMVLLIGVILNGWVLVLTFYLAYRSEKALQKSRYYGDDD